MGHREVFKKIRTSQHKQVFAQVKTLVDVGIKDVIEALNRIPNVWTLESCQGNKDEGAEIWLRYGDAGDDYKASAEFINRLYPMLVKHGCNVVDIALEWSCSGGGLTPMIGLYFWNSESKRICDGISDFIGVYAKDKKIGGVCRIPHE